MNSIDLEDNIKDNKIGKFDTEDSNIKAKVKNHSSTVNQPIAGKDLIWGDYKPTETSEYIKIVKEKSELEEQRLGLIEFIRKCQNCISELANMTFEKQEEIKKWQSKPITKGDYIPGTGIQIIYTSKKLVRKLNNEMNYIKNFQVPTNCEQHIKMWKELSKISRQIEDFKILINNYKG